ncbi:MAG TPA: tetratricopeptide repeat protein [Pseudolabrys sp.]|nr:tetratricopeptide repeat protein [Pseudolabrys sp.]
MRPGVVRALIIMAGLSLAGCETTSGGLSEALKPGDSASEAAAAAALASSSNTDASAGTQAQASAAESASPPPGAPVQAQPALLGSDPNDDLNLGKKQYREKNFGLAEKSFRRAVESHPRDAEAWLGLAAAYDRLRRFDLADRAYAQATKIIGPTVEILNNEGYSYMLRGDYRRAHDKLLAARRKDPANKYVQSNIALLEASYRKGKAIE